MCRHFNAGHSDQCEAVSHCSFDLYFCNNDIEHLFMCLLALYRSSVEKCLLRPLPTFWLGCIFVELLELFVYFGNKALLVTLFANTLFCRLSFHLFMVSFAVQNLVSLIRSFFFFAFISIAFGDWFKKTLVKYSFMVLCLIFKSFSYFELTFVYGSGCVLTSLIYMPLSNFTNTVC